MEVLEMKIELPIRDWFLQVIWISPPDPPVLGCEKACNEVSFSMVECGEKAGKKLRRVCTVAEETVILNANDHPSTHGFRWRGCRRHYDEPSHASVSASRASQRKDIVSRPQARYLSPELTPAATIE